MGTRPSSSHLHATCASLVDASSHWQMSCILKTCSSGRMSLKEKLQKASTVTALSRFHSIGSGLAEGERMFGSEICRWQVESAIAVAEVVSRTSIYSEMSARLVSLPLNNKSLACQRLPRRLSCKGGPTLEHHAGGDVSAQLCSIPVRQSALRCRAW